MNLLYYVNISAAATYFGILLIMNLVSLVVHSFYHAYTCMYDI